MPLETKPSEPKQTSGQKLVERLNADSVLTSTPVSTPEPAASTPEPTLSQQLSSSQESQDPAPEPILGDSPDTIEAPPSNPWLDQIRELGFEEVETEDQARERLIEAYRQTNQRLETLVDRTERIAPLVHYGKQYLEIQRDPRFQEVFGKPAEKKTEPKANPDQPQSWWNPPAYDPTLVAQYRVAKVDPSTGEIIQDWDERTPAAVRSSVEAYNQYIEDWKHKLVYSPQEAIGQAIRTEMERFYQEQRSKEQKQHAELSAFERFQQENADILFERDPITNRITSQLSKSGRIIQHFISELENRGVSDPEILLDYAMLRFEREFGAPNAQQPPAQPQAPAAPAPTVEDRKLNHLKQAAGLKRGEGALPPSRTGSDPLPTDQRTPRNKNLTPGHRLLEQLKYDHVI